MREAGTFENEVEAGRFSDLLLVRGIGNRVRDEEGNAWSVWVQDDDRLNEAGEILREFRANPDRPEYDRVSREAEAIRSAERNEQERYSRRMRASQIQWRYASFQGIGRVTLGLILISAVVALLSGLGTNREVTALLSIANYDISGHMIRWRPGFSDVWAGEFWRLITPIFVHFGFLHILFNMMWLKELGSQIEHRLSPAYLVALVLLIGVGSNVAQYLTRGPMFGGMSGVVYGLLGYIWMRGKHDPASGLFLDRNIVVFMMIWFVICLTGFVGNIANVAHGAGLLIGVAWGYVSAVGAIRIRRS